MPIVYEFASYRTSTCRVAYRGGPIPRIHRRRFHGGWMRSPRTLNENRANDSLAYDGHELPLPVEKLKSRGKLPTSWDDLMRSKNRSWKKHRRTQWK